MGDRASGKHDSRPVAIVERLRHGRSVAITGPNGCGRSHLLHECARLLSESAHDAVLVDCADADAGEQIAQADPASTLLIDGLEFADRALLSTVMLRAERGGSDIYALETGNQHSPYARAIAELANASHRTRRLIDSVHRVRLEPLAAVEVSRLVHEHSDAPVDSTIEHAIVALAEGRPRWALDLIVLAQSGNIDTMPQPAIRRTPHDEFGLPALRSVQRSIGSVSPDEAAAAIALAESGPLDVHGAEDLVGSPAVHTLLERGVLVRDDGQELFRVPRFVAAALGRSASREALHQLRNAATRRFIEQEALGLPLSDTETVFCALSLGSGPSSDLSSPPEAAQRRVLHRAAADLAAFGGEGAARTLLLRAGGFESNGDPVYRAEMVSALVGPLEALRAFATDPSTNASSDLAAAYLRALLGAESGESHEPEPIPVGRIDGDTATVLRLWNADGAISDAIPQLSRIAQHSPSVEIAQLAGALADLETVWIGRLPQSSWLASGAPVPQPRGHAPQSLRHLQGATLLTHSIVVLMAGEHALRRDELQAAAAALSPASFHQRWLRHLLAAGTALSCGNISRALIEWRGLIRTAPRFIPTRLRSYLLAIEDILGIGVDGSDDLGGPAGGGGPAPAIAHRFIAYLAGRHDALLRNPDRIPEASLPLPVVQLAYTHLTAVENQNPSELLRVAERLRRLELWAPARFALSEARVISLSRRAAGGVRRCDERIAVLERQIGERVSWYRHGDLPQSDLVQLTPREREVAGLAAEGLSNREIASRLGCSIRTVESHLGQARAKLGAPTRHEIATRLELRV